MAVQQRAFPEIEGPDFVKSAELAEVGADVVKAHGHIGGVGRIHPIAEAIRDGELKILWLLNTKPFNDQSEDDQEPEIAGRCVKAPGLWRDFTGFDFAIWARKHFWDQFGPELRRALVLHELLHIEVKRDSDGNPKFATRKHDVEDFVDVARQYGPAALAGDGARYVRAAALFAGEPEPAIASKRRKRATDVTTVTISAGGKSATVSGETFARLAEDPKAFAEAAVRAHAETEADAGDVDFGEGAPNDPLGPDDADLADEDLRPTGEINPDELAVAAARDVQEAERSTDGADDLLPL